MEQQYYGAISPFIIQSGYAKSTHNSMMKVRNPVNIAEMVNYCNEHQHIWLRDRNGKARQVKVNSKVRTWKRDPNRVEVPYKYGLYEYGTLYGRDITDVLIPVV